MSDLLFCGVEGGVTQSTVVLCNGTGAVLSTTKGPGTNFLLIGMEEVQARILVMTQEAMKKANIPLETPIKCICMSLSGAIEKSVIEILQDKFKSTGLAEEYFICEDTLAPIAAVSDNGGAVLIAGTGSNALVMNPDGTRVSCGGWGHLLGDEGSAYGISHMALKIYYDDEDGLRHAPNGYSTDVLWRTIQKHFNIKTRLDMLPHLYTDFEKNKIAKLCQELAVAAEKGDPLSQWLFRKAGSLIAKHLVVVSKGASKELTECEGGLMVVCVGSVWKSWNLLKPGFVGEIDDSEWKPYSFSLVTLTDDTAPAKGAAFLAAKRIYHNLPRDSSSHFQVFHRYKKGAHFGS